MYFAQNQILDQTPHMILRSALICTSFTNLSLLLLLLLPYVQLEIWSSVPTESEAIMLQSDNKSFDAAL